MANGDRDASPASPPVAALSATAVAELCRDSDDLLTDRRGFVAVRAASPAENGHTEETPRPAEPLADPVGNRPLGEPIVPAAADLASEVIGTEGAALPSPPSDQGGATPGASDAEPIPTVVAAVPPGPAVAPGAPEERAIIPVGPLSEFVSPDVVAVTASVGSPTEAIAVAPSDERDERPLPATPPPPMPESAASTEGRPSPVSEAVASVADELAMPVSLEPIAPSAPESYALADVPVGAVAPADAPGTAAEIMEPDPSPPAVPADGSGEAFAPTSAAGVEEAAVPLLRATEDALAGRTNGIGVHAATTVAYDPVTESPDPAVEADIADTGLVPADGMPNADGFAPPPVEAPEIVAPEGGAIEDPAGAVLAGPIILGEPGMPTIPPPAPPAPPQSAAPPPPAAPPPGDDEEDGASMTIVEHLEELRRRLTVSAISVVVGAVIGWFITPHVVSYLENGAKKFNSNFYSPNILGPFALELKLSFLIGLILASPWVLYQIWAFVAPGLTRRERRYALPFSLIGGGLFALGAVVGVLIVPLAIRFLIGFFPVLHLEQLLDITSYIMFIAIIAFIFGITFELPIFMVGFSLLGIVSSRFFIQRFKIAIFIIYGAAMLITPGADLVSPLVLGTFLIVLYWLGVLLIRFIGR